MPPICDTKCGATPAAGLEALIESLVFIAGEIEFGGGTTPEPFAFTQVASELHAVPVGALDPDSNLFDSPSPGTLRYIGTAPMRAEVSYAIAATVTAAPAQTPFFSNLLLNGEVVLETTQQGTINVPGGDLSFAGSADTMIVLQPGDELQVGLAGFITGAYTTLITALTLVANRV